MIPITRKELYLNKIVGNNEYDIPEKPITEEEFFFAEILGEAVQAPEPLTRYQIYLAKIAGKDVEIPYPETRLEYFLAKAAGMDVETPVPITREEIYWSNYTAIVEFEFEGVPPLTYKAIDGTLENYRIYGNTVGGESVGDRTGNLFDMKTFAETAYQQNATVNYSENSLIFTATQVDAYVNQVYSQMNIPVALRSSCINVQPLTTYTISMNAPYKCFISWINDSFDPVAEYTKIPNNQTSYTFTTPSNCTKLLIRLGKDVTNIGDTFTISNIMLNTGSTPLPYEPYGYKVPVMVSNGTDTLTTPIYLPEQIRKVGDEADYIDFEEQKEYVDADEEIEKQAATYMVSITPQTDVSKIVFVTMSSVPDDCTILISGLIFTLDEADANTLNSTNYADGVRGKATTAHNYKYSWTKKYTEGETYYIRSYVKYQTADNEIKEVYGDVYKADINGFERVRKNLHVTLPALPTLSGTNTLSVGTEVQPSKLYIKGKKGRE